MSEVAKKYNVSSSTVTMWIKATKENKNNLLTINNGNKVRIIDNQHNDAELHRLKEIGEKYRPTTHLKKLRVSDSFFKIFNDSQVSEIISSLETYKEIPHKYTYFDNGACIWSKYVDRSINENLVNTVTNTIELLSTSIPFLIGRLNQSEKINLIDIGTGDGRTLKSFIEYLTSNDRLSNYIGVDISQKMLSLLEDNFKLWFGKSVDFSTQLVDINKQSLHETLFYLTNSLDTEKTIKNVVLFLETTLENQREFDKTLLNIKESLGKNDKLILMQSLMSMNSKTYFDFWTQESKSEEAKIPNQGTWIPELLGLSSDMYEPEYIYDDISKSRIISIKPIHETEIEFLSEKIHKVITINKKERIILWRHNHHMLKDMISNLNSIGLDVDYVVSSKDNAQALMSCRISSK